MFLRSCNRNNANNEFYINSSGNVNNNNAYNANRGCPDCIAPAIRLTHSVGTHGEIKMQGAECPDTKSKQYRVDVATAHAVSPLLLPGNFYNRKMNLQESLEFEQLYDAMWKCKRGKMWKASVAWFVTHGIEEVLKLEQQNQAGTYKPRPPHRFTLYYPKLRSCSSTHIRDRVVQRSVNDNILYPAMTKSFIYDNMACQIGKGTTKALDRLTRMLHRYYINNGNDCSGYVLRCDVKGYYKNITHKDGRECFLRHIEQKTVDYIWEWMEMQYAGDTGYDPGSQMVQILGISLLDPLDHMAKEELGASAYERYMDDFFIISNDWKFLAYCRERMSKTLSEYSLNFHPDKTEIYPLSRGIDFLGFTFRLTKTGKVLRLIKSSNVKHERKKLYRMAQLVRKGQITKQKFYECYTAWKAHAQLGNTYKVIMRMDKYVKSLMEGITHENRKEERQSA